MSDVLVIIVNYLTGDLVEAAVSAITPSDFDIRVWDNSGDVSDAVRADAGVDGDGTNRMYAAPNNAIYAASDAEFVLLLNPDVQITPTAVLQLVDALRAEHQAWGAMPRLVGTDGRDQNYLRRLPTLSMLLADRTPGLRVLLRRPYDRYYCRDIDVSQSGIVEQPPAACLLVRREAVGPRLFDESYPLFFNDTDLARRLNADGMHCRYVADVTAMHIGGASIDRARATQRMWIRREYDRSLLRYARRNVRGSVLLGPIVLARIAVMSVAALLDRILRRGPG